MKLQFHRQVSRKVHPKQNSAMIAKRSGAALLEFAFTLPIFILLLLGVMEFASFFFTRNIMLHAARDAARSYAVGSLTAAEARARATELLPNQNFRASTSPSSSTEPDRWVEISIPVEDAALGDPLNVLGQSNLVVRVTMRREDQ